MRRILSMLLALVMVFTAIPWAAMAEETQNDTTVDTGEVTVEGTNAFGRLLSADIQEYQEDTAEEYQGGYTVTDLVIEGNTATVTYDALGEANLVVALYTEDGMQLLTSANTTVTADATEATVTFAGEMPEYFLASAYLVDTYDFSPLCEAYDTPMYTQDMQELLASTVEDYDPDRVLQLTEDDTTNFAVYAEGVILIEGAEGVNTVTSADDENLVYVIENADEQITGLAVGDILVYEYGEEELLIVRVSAINVDGTSVTITGDDSLTMEEAFDIVKVESHANSDSAEVSDLDAEDGIDFVDDSQTAPLLNAMDGSVGAGKTLSFEIKEKEITSKDGNRKATFSATWDLSLEIEVDYYISWKRSHVELKIDYETALVGSIDGSIEFELKDFASLKIKPVSGVTIKLEPKLELEFSGEASLSVALNGTLGVKLDTKKNAKNLCTVPKVSVSVEAEGSIFFGISLNPTVTLINKKVTKLTASVPIGLNIEAEADLLKGEIALGTVESIHTCDHCLDISVSVSLKAKAEAKFLNAKKLTVTKTFAAILKEFPFYWSFTENDFGSGSCPHVSYLTSFLVKYKDESYVTEAEVTVTGRDGTEHEETTFTNKFGTAYFYLPAGKYTATITDGTFTKTTKFTISDEARQKRVTLKDEADSGELGSFLDRISSSVKVPDIIDLVTTLASGTCGADLSWKLSGSGMLIISGSGDMTFSGSTQSSAPWYNYRTLIKSVSLPDGLTSIANYAFYGCTNLSDISFPDGLKGIGSYAFQNCSSLGDVEISDGVTWINQGAFMGSGITSITIPGSVSSIGKDLCANCDRLTSVTIENGLSYIVERAFSDCDSLPAIHIPGSVKKIEANAFYSCDSLTTVTMDDGVVTIYAAFSNCEALEEVQLSQTLTSIKTDAFRSCRALKQIELPDSLTEIGNNAFYDCSGLTSILLPDGISKVQGFRGCKSLRTVVLPARATSIEMNAFLACTGLEEIEIPDTVTKIGRDAFKNCKSLTQITIPASVTNWSVDSFQGCNKLTAFSVAEGNPSYMSKDGVVFTKDMKQLFLYPPGKTGAYEIPAGVTSTGEYAFYDCDKLTDVTIPDSVTVIGKSAFWDCDRLTSIHLPASITEIGGDAFSNLLNTDDEFYNQYNLSEIWFSGNYPTMAGNPFNNVVADVYYPAGNATWTEEVLASFDSSLTLIPYTVASGSAIPDRDAAVTGMADNSAEEEAETTETGNNAPALDAVYGGEYSTEETEGITLKKATFSGLVPGEEYLLLAMASIDTDTPLAPENLLFIDQAAAAEDGTLTFTYVQRVTTDPSFVVACGAASKTLADAAITFPEMVADGELHAVEPTVLYDGTTLQEGRDYEITGTVSYTDAGTYICYIRGIHNYTGTMKCTYTVTEGEEPEVPADPTDPEEPTDPENPTDPVDPEEPELDGVIRIAGSDRIATSLMLADQLKEVLGVEKFDAVVVASALNFPDALTGSYLAAEKKAPILLTYPAAHAKIRAYIQENLKAGGMVYILGGEGAVSADFANGLNSFNIKRLAGSDRFGTNLEIMKEAGNYDGKPVLIATAVNFADSLSASAAGLPMVLVYGSLREDQKEFLATTSRNFIIIGGEAAVSPALEAELKSIGSVTRVAGSSRYETSVLVAERFVQNPDAVILAYAKNFPDGLCGGPLAYALGAPLILTDSGSPGTADAYVENITAGIVVGGSGLISDAAARAIFDLAANAHISTK